MEVSAMEYFDYPPEELLPIVAELAARYTSYEHSSIPYEKARMLMEAVLYCINEFASLQGSVSLANHVSAKDAYRHGRDIVLDKAKKLHQLYHTLLPEFQDYGSACLRDTVIRGIPLFLSRYDIHYAPQETLLTLDYPVLRDISSLSGVDAVLAYMECISLEQQFLKKLDYGYLTGLLRRYHEEYEALVENLCPVVLQNLFVHRLLGRTSANSGFDKGDYDALGHLLSGQSEKELTDSLMETLRLVAGHYNDNDGSLLHYLEYAVPDIITRLRYSFPPSRKRGKS